MSSESSVPNPDVLRGDPIAYVGEQRQERAKRAAIFVAVLFDGCAMCDSTDAGHGDEGELCEDCAAELGVL